MPPHRHQNKIQAQKYRIQGWWGHYSDFCLISSHLPVFSVPPKSHILDHPISYATCPWCPSFPSPSIFHRVNSYLLPVTRHHFWVLLKENCTWTYRHLHTIFYSIYLLFIKTLIIPHCSLSVYMYAYINSDQKFQVLTHDILLANGWWNNSNLILSLRSARWFTRN